MTTDSTYGVYECSNPTCPCHTWAKQETATAEPQLTEDEAQLVIGAIPLQVLPIEPRCPYCGETKANHGDYNSGVYPEPRQPTAPESGDGWHVVSESSTPDGDATIKRNGEWIGQVKRKYAAIIVHDRTLALLVPGLVDALRNESLPRADGDCWCDNDYRKGEPHTDHCRNVRWLVSTAHAAGKGGRG